MSFYPRGRRPVIDPETGEETFPNYRRVATINDEPSLTQQNMKEDAELTTMIKKFGIAQLPQPMEAFAMYGDFTGVTDLTTAYERIADAEEAFMELPADIRKRFNHNAQELLTFVEARDENLDEGIEMGIFERPPGHQTAAELEAAALAAASRSAPAASAAEPAPPAPEGS